MIKRITGSRVVQVGTTVVLESEDMPADALHVSEDSNRLNTAFIERLNLIIRRGSPYLTWRSPCHARKKRTIDDHLELLRNCYNFGRPHGSLKFGEAVRTPAMKAMLATKRLSFRGIFTTRTSRVPLVLVQSQASSHHGQMESAKCAA
ncbi:MAG: hypothetical protein ACI9F9_000808 [Candidatus Paceibacteria bacterium]|jgi:hypothetical protein